MRLAVTTLILATGSGLRAQDCSTVLRGRVFDEHDGQALEAATVFLEGAAEGTYTGADGRFELRAPCGKTDTLFVDHIGCEPTRRGVRLDGGNLELSITLEHHTELLSGIEVHAHRSRTSAADIGGALSGEQLDRSAGEDLATVASALPGVRQLSTGAGVSRPLVDGLGGARLQIVEGGTALASQDWGDEHAPEVDPFASASLHVSRGGATVRYGASTTGATLVLDDEAIPAPGAPRGRALAVAASNARSLGGGAEVGHRLNPRWGYRARAFGSSAGDARAPDYVLSNTGQRRASGRGRLYYADTSLSFDVGYRGFFQESGILRAAHIGNLTDLERALASERPLVIRPYTRDIDAPRQRSAHHWGSANARYDLGDGRSLRVAFSTQVNLREEFDVRRGGRSAKPSLDLTLTTHNLRVEWAPGLWWGWRTLLGVNGYDAANRNDPGTGVRPFIPYYDASGAGAYIEQSRLSEAVALEWSARVDHRRTDAFYFARGDGADDGPTQVSRRETTGAAAFGVVRYLGDDRDLRARLSYGSRVPNPAERFAEGLHHALAVIEVGDTSLRVEHGLKASVGGGYRVGGLEVQVAAYAHAFRDFIYQQARPEPALTIRGAFPVLEYRQGDALLAGVDVDAHLTAAPFDAQVTAGYVYGVRDGGEPLPDIAPLRLGGELGYSRSLRSRLKDWRVSATATYVARQSQTPDFIIREAPPGYLLTGLAVSGHLGLGGANTLGVHLAAHNLLDVTYRDYLDRFRFYADRPGRDIQLRLLYDF